MIEIFLPFYHAWADVRDFTETGGWVLVVIAAVIFLMWGLILERALYQQLVFPGVVRDILRDWEKRRERRSWAAHRVREKMVSEAWLGLERSLPMIKTLVAVCPLLGLLGTVTGMVEVFEVMAITGTGNARQMAAGVSRATIPTLAGMVGALTGVFASSWLERRAARQRELLEDHLTNE